jgi:hypothetical protein
MQSSNEHIFFLKNVWVQKREFQICNGFIFEPRDVQSQYEQRENIEMIQFNV